MTDIDDIYENLRGFQVGDKARMVFAKNVFVHMDLVLNEVGDVESLDHDDGAGSQMIAVKFAQVGYCLLLYPEELKLELSYE